MHYGTLSYIMAFVGGKQPARSQQMEPYLSWDERPLDVREVMGSIPVGSTIRTIDEASSQKSDLTI